MCGRYATTRSAIDLSALFGASDETADGLGADYNVAPTDPVPIVRVSHSRAQRVLEVARWGLVPAWSKDIRGAARMINARVETVESTPAYASSFAKRRCLVPADGWYEWVRRPAVAPGGGKQPYFMTRADGGALAFAGLWSVWGSGDDRLLTCTVITMPAIGELSAVHDRMPLVLDPSRWDAWLNTNGGEAATLLAPPTPESLAELEIRPVGPAVGDVRNDGPQLVQRVAADPLTGVTETPVDLTLF